MNKIYIVGVLALILIIGGGMYWRYQKAEVSSTEQDVALEGESLNKDNAELDELGGDTSLDTIGEDLAGIAEETGSANTGSGANKIETASMENLESELALELNGFSDDSGDLEGFQDDKSLDDIDSGLSIVTE